MDVGHSFIILLKDNVDVEMPLGKREKRWLRPISELRSLGGAEELVTAEQSPQSQQPLSQAQPQPQQYQQVQQSQQSQQSQPQPQQSQQSQPQPQQVQQFIMQQSEMDGGTMDLLSVAINTLNTNPYFIGMLMLLLNLGGRFLAMELSPKQEQFLQQRWLRPLLFFTVIFIATRNLAVAFWMTLALFMILWILANEQSPFCMIPSWRTTGLDTSAREKQYEDNTHAIEAIYHANH